MVMPGATIRNPRVNFELVGRRTLFNVCQAITMAMTVVLPAPVASFRARRLRPGFAPWFAASMCSRNLSPFLPICGATSVSQIAVSTASTWQKKGRISLNLWCRQCLSRRWVSGVTFQSDGSGIWRQRSTSSRSALMIVAFAYRSSSPEIASSIASSDCWPPVCRLARGMGVMKSARRRASTML